MQCEISIPWHETNGEHRPLPASNTPIAGIKNQQCTTHSLTIFTVVVHSQLTICAHSSRGYKRFASNHASITAHTCVMSLTIRSAIPGQNIGCQYMV